MKEFFALLKDFDLKGIFLTPTKNGFLQFFRYLFVGGIATVVDWGVLMGLTELLQLHHLVSAIFAFVAGLGTNFLLSKLLVFRASEAKTNSLLEFLGYALIGVIGLGMTELIMFLFTDCMSLHYMLSKAIATAVVLVWNYLARKLLLYKN
jgi:putative flippase GtrA